MTSLRQCYPEQDRAPTDSIHALSETAEVAQIYVLDEWPGPSAHLFIDGVFARWMPGLTYERAVEHGARL